MSRLTKYEPSKDSMFPYKLVDNELSTELDAIHQLGRFEDLMEEYNINSIEQLENILGSKFLVGGFRSGGKSIVGKGMLYNILSEQLGCPLEVVFKVLLKNEGIRTIKNNTYYIYKIVRMANGHLAFELELAHYIYLKDYRKTWWLKGEKENAN